MMERNLSFGMMIGGESVMREEIFSSFLSHKEEKNSQASKEEKNPLLAYGWSPLLIEQKQSGFKY